MDTLTTGYPKYTLQLISNSSPVAPPEIESTPNWVLPGTASVHWLHENLTHLRIFEQKPREMTQPVQHSEF